MIGNIDGNLPVTLLARPIERAGVVVGESKVTTAAVRTYDFQFRVNTETHEITALIIDPDTRAVIKEIPPKEMHAAADVIRSLIGPQIDKVV